VSGQRSQRSLALSAATIASLITSLVVSFSVKTAAETETLIQCAERVRGEVRAQLDAGMPQAEADLVLQTRFAKECLGDPADPPSNATAFFVGALNREYHRLAYMFVMHKLNSSSYLGLVRDRSGKMKRARHDATYVDMFAQGDADGDFVPDRLDRCPGTKVNAVTTPDGCPDPKIAGPKAPADRDVRRALSYYRLDVTPACYDAPPPDVPQPLRLGYTSGRTAFKLAVVPVERDPEECPIYYEFNVTMVSMLGPGNPVYRGYVFKDSENTNGGSGPAVFEIPSTIDGASKYLFILADLFTGAQWRVRAVNGAGVASPWSTYEFQPTTVFAQP
jgi:hypothetical protein